MKKYILLIIGVVFALCSSAQTDGYNPDNPPNPVWEDSENAPVYRLACEAIPDGTGQFGGSANKDCKAGQKVTVYANDHHDCYFQCWKDAAGNTLTTEKSYSFTMPANNLTLYAFYTYSPDSPSNPEHVWQYLVKVKCEPEVAATFNFKDQKVDEGSVQTIRASAHNGFHLLHWKNEKGDILGTELTLKYLVPAHASELTAVFEYQPDDPNNPGTNSWEEMAGEMVVDFFTTGELNSTMQKLAGSDHYDKVTHLTVDGIMDRYDFYFSNTFKKLTYIDLSRIDGITEIPASTWDKNSDLQEIELPANINKIGNYAFRECTALHSFSIYAMVPPTLGANTFSGVPADMVVFVPESAVEIYQQTDVWKDFTIAPLQSKFGNLNITFKGDEMEFNNHILEVMNVKNGQRLRYLVKKSKAVDALYTFPNLIRNSKHKVFLKSQNDHILAETDFITIDNENVDIDITKVKKVYTLKGQEIYTIEGNNAIHYEDECTYVWTNAEGEVIGNEYELPDMLEGTSAYCTVTLSKQLATRFVTPQKQLFVADGTQGNSSPLQPYKSYNVNVNIKDAFTQSMIKQARVVIGQTYVDKFNVTNSTLITSGTEATIQLFAVPTTITVSSQGYVDNVMELTTDQIEGFQENGSIDVLLEPLVNEVTATVEFSYYPALDEDDPNVGKTEPFHNFNNIAYTLYNRTKQTDITKFNVNGNLITIFENVDENDQVELSCTCKDNTMSASMSTASAIVKNGKLTYKVDLNEYVSIKARFLITDNSSVDALLYDEKGELIKTATYANFNPKAEEGTDANNLTFSHVPSGTYTLVTIGHSDYFNSIYSLNDFESIGLTEGVDFVKNVITPDKYRNIAVRNVVVPFFDESKFYYTGTNTSFSVNKASVIQGNYLTLNARIDFLDDIKERVSDIQLVFPIPESAEMVDGSLIRGKSIANYTYENHTVTIPMTGNYTDRVKFCIIPTKRGNYTPTAYVQFTLDGKTVKQPIGSAAYTVTDITMWTPKLISTPTLFIQGNAPSMSNVLVYADGFLIGETKALADGYWQLESNIYNVTNLSMHEISAEITTTSGIKMTTESRFVEYNKSGIQAKSVEMSFFNNLAAVQRTIFVGFDLERYKTTSSSYMFQAGTEFVFTADLTNNDPEIVHSCIIRVFTNNHEWIELPAQYIPNLNRWVAHGKFENTSAPIGVRVEVDADLSEQIDYQELITKWTENIKNTINAKDRSPKRAGTIDTDHFTFDYASDENSSDDRQFFFTNATNVDLKDFTADTIIMPTTEDGKEVRVYVADNGSYVIIGDNDEGKAWGVKYLTSNAVKPRKARIDTELVTEFKQHIELVSNVTNMIVPYTDYNTLGAIVAQLKMHADKWAITPPTTPAEEKEMQLDQAKLAVGNKIIDNFEHLTQLVRDANSLLSYAHYGIEDVNEWQAFVDRILPCDGLDDPQARALYWISQRHQQKHGKQYITSIKIAEAAVAILGAQLFFIESNPSASEMEKLLAISDIAREFVLKFSGQVMTNATDMFLQNKAASRNHIRKAKRDKNRYNCNYDYVEVIDPKWDFSLPYPIVEPIIDPSGFVYEGVSSNRLPGVTATAFYMHQYEDMYGDIQQEVVKWDAENYNQKNPLLTDEKGMYQWDVPQGLWQVKFEREGYQTAYSEWLPVPPPQMDINIGMVQLTQPEVVSARAFEAGANTEGGVEIIFDKYMKPASINTDRIFVKGVKDGEETLISGLTISFPDKEIAIEGDENEYAKKVFVTTDQLGLYDEAYIIVGNLVESYAGLPMANSYQQKLEVEKRITSVAVDETVNISYDGKQTMYVAALPTEAAAGKKIRITSASTKIATLGNDEESILLTLDADGQAEFTVNAVLYGSTALEYEVINEDLTAQSLINVVEATMLEQVKEPIASRISGTAVFRGQTVALTCETEGAQIYYTLDGTCPCESATRRLYTGPIAINDAMTLRIMAQGVNGTESTVRDYNYLIRQSNVSLHLAEGWNWTSHDLAEALPVSELESLVERILTQTEELINDPTYGFVGTLTEIDPTSAVKLQTTNAATKTFTGEQYNPSLRQIPLKKGWNWLGYPIDQKLTVQDALSYLNAEEGDYITNLEDGFAQFTDGKWIGQLQTMTPGQGYLYKSASDKNFIYNIVPSTTPVPHRLHQAPQAPFTVNPHRYPNMMSVTARLFVNGEETEEGHYSIGAFCGDECRGVGQYINGIIFLSVYGENIEELHFVAANEMGETFTTTETVTFTADVLGSAKSPYIINTGNTTGISALNSKSVADGNIYNLAGQRVNEKYQGVIIKDGKKLYNK